jgi:hypothetical protein
MVGLYAGFLCVTLFNLFSSSLWQFSVQVLDVFWTRDSIFNNDVDESYRSAQ